MGLHEKRGHFLEVGWGMEPRGGQWVPGTSACRMQGAVFSQKTTGAQLNLSFR